MNCVPNTFQPAEILVLIAGSVLPAPVVPASTRISTRLKCVRNIVVGTRECVVYSGMAQSQSPNVSLRRGGTPPVMAVQVYYGCFNLVSLAGGVVHLILQGACT